MVIEDTADGAVRIEKIDQLGLGESAQTITPASVLAEEILRFAESFDDGTETKDAEESASA